MEREKNKQVRKETVKETNMIAQWVIPTFFLSLFLIITFFSYYKYMEKKTTETVLLRHQHFVDSLSKDYENRIYALTQIGKVAANRMSDSEGLDELERVRILSGITKNTSAKKAYFVKMNGSAVDDLGIKYEKIPVTENVSTMLDGIPKVTEFCNDEHGNKVLMIVSPIMTETEMLGSVVISYEPSELMEVIDSPNYLSTNTYVLVTDHGDVLECVGEDNLDVHVGENLFEKLEATNVSFVQNSLRSLTRNILNQANGVAEVLYGGTGKYLVYESVGSYHCSVVMAMNSALVKNGIREENKETSKLIFRIAMAFVLFIVIIISINRISKLKYIDANKELQNKADTDLLTDLLNKIATEKKIIDYLQNEGKGKRAMMFVLDIDNFKKINDTMGHAFGDEVLSTLGKQIRGEFRVNDIIGRTGGDEFIIFLKDLKDDATMKREAERVAEFFKNFRVGEYTKYSATASIGAAAYPADAQDFESLYKAADQALYKAKKRGKNQLAFYRDETGE